MSLLQRFPARFRITFFLTMPIAVFLIAAAIAEQNVYRIIQVLEPPLEISDLEMQKVVPPPGPAPDRDHVLVRIDLDAKTDPDFGQPGVINEITTTFAAPPVDFENLLGSRFNADTECYEFDGYARLNILDATGLTLPDDGMDDPDPIDGVCVEAVFVQKGTGMDSVVEVTATNLITQAINPPCQTNVLDPELLIFEIGDERFVGLTPILSVGDNLFSGCHLGNDSATTGEGQSVSRSFENGTLEDWELAQDKVSSDALYATISIRGNPLSALLLSEDKVYLSFTSFENADLEPLAAAQLNTINNLQVGDSGVINIWVQDPLSIDGSATFDFSTSTAGVIEFTGSTVFNPDILGMGMRWADTCNGLASGQTVTNMMADTLGTSVGINPVAGVPELDDLYNDASFTESFLFGQISFDVIGSGSTDVVFSTADIVDSTIPPTGFVFNNATVNAQSVSQPSFLGDVNCDGELSLLDIGPFLDLITTGGFDVKADVNQDGFVNLLDVAPFIDLFF